MGCVINYFS